MKPPSIATRAEWLAARKVLLAEEKKLTHLNDEVARKRRALPWVEVTEAYVFDGPDGKVRLADLFDGRSQLFVYHFMLPPGAQDPCPGCSFISDHVDAARQHFEHADLSFAAVSRAPLAEISKVKQRMGWKFPWVSAHDSSFNYDYGASFTKEQLATGKVEYNYDLIDNDDMEDLHGSSIFVKDDSGRIYHTYSCFARGDERMLGAFAFLDLTPKGRSEEGGTMCWVRLHDRYEDDGRQAACCACSCGNGKETP